MVVPFINPVLSPVFGHLNYITPHGSESVGNEHLPVTAVTGLSDENTAEASLGEEAFEEAFMPSPPGT